MRSPNARLGFLGVLALASLLGCSRFGAVYPPRPPEGPGAPVADPAPSRLVVHAGVTGDALGTALEDAVPRTGEGDFPLLGSPRHYTWTRAPLTLHFAAGRLLLVLHVDVVVALPLRSVTLPFDLDVAAEPVVTRDYVVKLQSVEVKVASNDRRVELANAVAGVFDVLSHALSARVEAFAYDLRPLVAEAYGRIVKPIRFPVGEAEGCARTSVLGVMAGPTVVADGIEKDLALVVAPEVTLPCAADTAPPPLPPLENVAGITPGPFTVSVPIAASYDELARAMKGAFTDGKLFFAKDYPGLYLENPRLYESQGLIVLQLHLAGPVHALGIDTDLDGDLYFSGHLAIQDNELTIPDLEPTIETNNLLLSLKAATGARGIRDQARAALRLDLGEKLAKIKAAIEGDLTFGGKDACFHGDLDKVEVVSAFPHGTYLRVYVNVTGRAAVTMPCATETH